jgi:ABC-type dipeptide/oligopeptide/nickel transport system ATPase component
MSLTRILGALDQQVTPSAEPLLPGNHIIYAICGRKGSGKSTLLLSLLKSKRAFRERWAHIHFVSPTARGDPKFSSLISELEKTDQYHDMYSEQIMTNIFDKIKTLNTAHEARKKKRKRDLNHLIILDDCANDLPPSKAAMLSRIVVQSRHNKTSVLILSQKYNAISPLIRAQLDLLSVFKSYNNREITTLIDDVSINPKTFMEIYNFATEGDHSFLHMNLLTNPITFFKRFDRLDVDLDDLARTQ